MYLFVGVINMSRSPRVAFNLFRAAKQMASRSSAPARRLAADASTRNSAARANLLLPAAATTSGKSKSSNVKLAATLLSLSAATAYAVSLAAKETTPPEETVIELPSIDLSKYNDERRLIVNLDEFDIIGEKPKGHLSGKMLKHKATGDIYYMKGATSFENLVKEVLFAETMRMIEPKQPKGLLLQDIQPTGQAVFYTLSQVHPGSIDLEDFVEQELYKGDKPLLGMKTAIMIDLLFGKQSDMKLQNYVAIPLSKGDTFHGQSVDQDSWGVVCIDHEIALTGVPILTRNQSQTRDELGIPESYLQCLIRDYSEGRESNPGQVAPPKLANDPRVGEFLDKALTIDDRDVDGIYTRLAGESTAFPMLESMVAILCQHHKNHGIMSHKDHRHHLETLRNIQDKACRYVNKHGLEPNDEAPAITASPSP